MKTIKTKGDDMLHDGPNYPQTEMGMLAKAEQCRPNYEEMIKSSRKAHEKAAKFLSAIFEYKGETGLSGKMAELVGELYSEMRMYEYQTQRLIAEQEESEKR